MVIIDTYIVFDCSLFLLLLFFSSFIVIRCEMSLVKFSNDMWWKMCDSSGARAHDAVNDGADVDLLFCVVHARTQTSERVAAIRAWSMKLCMCVCGCT